MEFSERSDLFRHVVCLSDFQQSIKLIWASSGSRGGPGKCLEIPWGSLGVLWEFLGVLGGPLGVPSGSTGGPCGGPREVSGGPKGGANRDQKHIRFSQSV